MSQSTNLTLQTPGLLYLTVDADASAAGHAALAVEVADPAVAHAVQYTGQEPYVDVSSGGDVFRDAHPSPLDNRAYPVELPAGRYRLIVACDGDGIVASTLTVGHVSSTTEVHCSQPQPTVDFATVVQDKPTTNYGVRFDPRTVTPGTALAYRLVRA